MDSTDIYSTAMAVCLLVSMMAYEAGLPCTGTVLCLAGVVFVVMGYVSMADDEKKRRRKRQRRRKNGRRHGGC